MKPSLVLGCVLLPLLSTLNVFAERWIVGTVPSCMNCDQFTRRLSRFVQPTLLASSDICIATFHATTPVALSLHANILCVSYVEPESMFYSNKTKSWGIDRIDQLDLPLNNRFETAYHGRGETIYIFDTGVFQDHKDFEYEFAQSSKSSGNSRVIESVNFSDDLKTDTGDNNGHGTHCAGTAAGKTFGVASQAEIVSVKVLSSNGRGATSSIVQGVEWAIQHRKGKGPAVFSMSLGGRPSTALDITVQRATDAGHIVVVAAGNDANDACRFSPARLGGNASVGFGVITVAATDKWDHRPGYSNYGHCVDLFAPGTAIVSASHDSQGSKSLSGTSMSAPHVAGVAATLLEKHGGSKTAAITEMFEIASRDRVEGALKETPNILVQATKTVLITLPPIISVPPVCDFGRRTCRRRKKCRWLRNPTTRKNECIDRYGTPFPTPAPTLRPSRSPVTPRPSRAPTQYPTRRPRN